METIRLHATLRGVTKCNFEALLASLELGAVANTRIGEAGATGRRKGLSGGERKRVATALELLHSPPLLILDEPLSGLDSAAAAQVSALLSRLARGSQAVLITLHQPSSRDYAQVAHLGLLSPHGQTVFFGPAPEAIDHFASASAFNQPLPEQTIPAEHFLDVLADKAGAADPGGHGAPPQILDPSLCRISEKTYAKIAQLNGNGHGGGGVSGLGRPTGGLKQAAVLFRRANLDNLRHPAFLRAMFSRSVMMALIVGHLYSGLGDDQGSVQVIEPNFAPPLLTTTRCPPHP
jgi:hypothetical protein